MMSMTLEQIAQAVNGLLVLAPNSDVNQQPTNVVIDSRIAKEGTLFVAIRGEHSDGHDYVADLGKTGAIAAITDHEIAESSVAQIVVENTVTALGDLARRNLQMRREQPEEFSIIGITGSVGKTTTKDLLHALLSELGETVAPVGSFNNELGLPLTALKVGPTTRFLIAEMGANHVGEIAKLTKIAPPDVSVVLKVGTAHLGEFGSVERIAQAKSEIVLGERAQGMTVLNADDPHVAAMDALAPGMVTWFGMEHAAEHDAFVSADHVHMDETGHAVFTLRQTDGAYQQVRLGIPGEHNVMNALAATAVAEYYGLPLRSIVQVLENVRSISPHRMEEHVVAREGKPEFMLIDDSFNANPDSMRAGINGLMAFNAAKPMTRIAILGAMLELGDNEHELHKAIGRYAREQGVDAVIAVGNIQDAHLMDLAAHLAQGVEEVSEEASEAAEAVEAAAPEVAVASSIDEAEQMLDAIATSRESSPDASNTVVLLKGSHASGLASLAERWAEHFR
ncbi:UDP-N-acetylmuramoyl-tripeptide--D-alanyl-D-alan ine ligase [Bifidobacterium dolichotidis]|uniref:UDP-N-acetylmuramoyl-tripeptide--D-alanyl-D-alanine ligase n=1 Tax=Bifidobacterium dolichotidis TaxID=2306976 RepID=A0A430FS83_9BIFI|nr:UDP-N-acetylmuramoyl-tripeptide--D-alanyl-D-alanine ligase [Bifidobacterium dolichotidis]RSX55697.1 UDP-N-acetylmuramoyl-tripeptide--D-alanyl-D-alan ine ligase [Bifidobacterium dolichotidis]